jgi:hypothetical protein
MSWKTRKGRQYYYESRREGGRVRSVYCGRGPRAELAEVLGAEARRDREEARALARADLGRHDARDAALTAYHKDADVITHAVLDGYGYHKHARAWRKSRMKTKAKAPPAAAPTVPATPKAVAAVLIRARDGDESALPTLRAIFDAHPQLFEGLTAARQAEKAVVDAACGGGDGTDRLSREVFTREVDAVAVELAGPAPSAAERLLARRAALAWFAVNVEEFLLAKNRNDRFRGPEYAEHKLRLIDRRHRQFVTSVKALALVKRAAAAAVRVSRSTTHTTISAVVEAAGAAT